MNDVGAICKYLKGPCFFCISEPYAVLIFGTWLAVLLVVTPDDYGIMLLSLFRLIYN